VGGIISESVGGIIPESWATCSGIASRAERIQLRSLVAKDVPIVVHSTGAYGDGIDGLLGMSFLSRFNIKIDTRSVNISTRKAP
jgi:hypothetical protein